MRLLVAIPFLVLLHFAVFAQTESLPDVLKPDAVAEAEAARMGARALKLLPHPLFYKDSPIKLYYDDKDFPLGIRGSGAFYSFANQSHSYNRHPEIYLVPPRLASGPTTTFTLIRDVGTIDLSLIGPKSPEVSEFLDYKYPRYFSSVLRERERLEREMGDDRYLTSGKGRLDLKYRVGNTYVYRAITFDRSDIIVAFKVLSTGPDGSVTLAWKELHRLPKPIGLYMSDEELQQKIDEVILAEAIGCDRVIVKDNWLYLQPDPLRPRSWKDNEQLFLALKKRNISYRGSGPYLPK